MFWNKKEENEKPTATEKDETPQKTEIPPQQASTNCKFEFIKFYAITDSLAFERKFYRTVFEQEETTFLYWEVTLFNRRFGEMDWKATITTKCYKIDAGNEEKCNIPAEITVAKTADIYRYRYSWGTETPGYWKAGIYRWDIYINDELIGGDIMRINNFGSVTAESNPYFDLLAIKLCPSFEDKRELKEGYRYLTQFNTNTAEYINVELEIKRKLSVSFNYEFVYNIIRDDSYHIAVFSNISSLDSGVVGKSEIIRYGWGAIRNYWKKGNYVVSVNFMGQKIASATFSVGDAEILGVPSTANYKSSGQAFLTGNIGSQSDKTIEVLLQELDLLIGMNKVKESIRENIDYLKFNKIRIEKGFKDDSAMNLHSVFTGNPGTGKTTIVRLLGQIYKSLGLLSKGNVVEVGRAELIAEFIGQTAPKVKKAINDARGGILFIDEAYALKRGGDSKNDFGQEAIEVILKEMSDGAGDIAIVVAGYPEEMQIFINSNPGLKSRFKQYFHFDDYLPDELMEISKVALQKEETNMDATAEKMLKQYITEQYRNRDRSFGNARLMYGIIDEAKKQMGLRLLKNEQIDTLTREELSTITADDLAAMLYENVKGKLILSIEEKN